MRLARRRTLAAAGAAIFLPQRELTPERLDAEVRGLMSDEARLGALARAALTRARPDAAEVIARRLLATVRGSAV
jgi:UDP-N-acetylglucosamine--N-acetylmuramyl-(pentapeptide) pyrophosphoryl-undecaprenol N-acetylglucosamine transferase